MGESVCSSSDFTCGVLIIAQYRRYRMLHGMLITSALQRVHAFEVLPFDRHEEERFVAGLSSHFSYTWSVECGLLWSPITSAAYGSLCPYQGPNLFMVCLQGPAAWRPDACEFTTPTYFRLAARCGFLNSL